MVTFTKEMMDSLLPNMKKYRKKVITSALRVKKGRFKVATREGTLECPDGYLAIDSDGWPYPIAKEEFEKIYEEVSVDA